MKKITLLAAVFMAFVCSNAQTVKVKTQWETALNQNLQKKNVYNDYLGEDDKSYFILYKKIAKPFTYNYGVERYDKQTLKPVAAKTLDNIGEIDNIYRFGGETYARIHENPQKHFRLAQDQIRKLYKFNKETMTFEPVKELADVNLAIVGKFEISQDESKILFVLGEISASKKEDDHDKFLVLDNNLNKLWEKSLPELDIEDCAVSNDGTVYFAFFAEDKKNKKNPPACMITKLSKDSEKKFTVNMDGNLYQKINLTANKDNELLALGFYTNKANEDKTGSYYFSMNENFDQAENIIYNEIPLNILNANTKKKRTNERYSDYEFGTALYGENGDIVICAEESTSRRRTSTTTTHWPNVPTPAGSSASVGGGVRSVSSSTITTVYHYDTYVFKINGGKLSWVKRVPKYQLAGDSEKVADAPLQADRLGYEVFLSGDHVVLVFTDLIANMNNDEFTEKQRSSYANRSGKDNEFMSVILDKEGKQKRQIIDTSALDKEKLDIEMANCVRIANNLALVTARKAIACKIGIITMDK